MNPYLCGYVQDAEKNCTCSANVVAREQKRISGPLLDRIDIHVDLPRVNYEKLSGQRLGEPSRPCASVSQRRAPCKPGASKAHVY